MHLEAKFIQVLSKDLSKFWSVACFIWDWFNKFMQSLNFRRSTYWLHRFTHTWTKSKFKRSSDIESF